MPQPTREGKIGGRAEPGHDSVSRVLCHGSVLLARTGPPSVDTIVYRIDEDHRIVHVLDIDHRSEIYHRPQQ
jgi:hypothetical protein